MEIDQIARRLDHLHPSMDFFTRRKAIEIAADYSSEEAVPPDSILEQAVVDAGKILKGFEAFRAYSVRTPTDWIDSAKLAANDRD